MSPGHFLGLHDAQTVLTPAFELTKHAVNDVAATYSIAVVHGPAGAGKTFATDAAVAQLTDHTCCRCKFPSGAKQAAVVKHLLKAVTGVAHTSGESYDHIDTLLTHLAEEPRLLVVDEAQELSRDALKLLRHLWEDPDTQFGLVLTGADGCWDLISSYPPLESRVMRQVRFSNLSPAQVVEAIPRFHPLYEETSRDVLTFIDTNFAKGNLRKWARFTVDAVRFSAQHRVDEVTKDLASSIFSVQRTTPVAPQPGAKRPTNKEGSLRGAR